jgi:subtilisin family serine protease
MRQLASAQGATVKSTHPAKSSKSISYAVFSSKSMSTDQLIAKFKGRSNVVAVSANNYEHISTVPNDPQFPNQWEMQDSSGPGIDAPQAWDLTTGSSDVVVAVIDTGMAYTHVDLKDNVWANPGEIAGNGKDDDGNGYVDDVHGIDVVDGTSDPWDDNGHGTHVSGTIAAEGNNGIGVAGVSWKTKIMPLKFLDSNGYGSDDGAIACINYAIDMKVNRGVNLVAINASWGGGYADAALENAIQAAGDAGIIFCAAAGNDGLDVDSTPEYPAAYPCSNIISVGASDSTDSAASFSNYGATNVDLFAPGTNILSTYIKSQYTAPGSNDIFYDGMQAGAGNWTPSGTWAITDELHHNGNLVWSDSPGGNYTNWEDSSLTSRVIDLSKADPRDTMLSFYLSSNLRQGSAVLNVEAWDPNDQTWTFLDSYTGNQSGTCEIAVPASLLTNKFQLRFRLVTDGSPTADGVYLDDIGIASVPPNTYVAWNGTSMATPHVTGTVALLAAASPTDSVAARIDRILSNVDQLSSLSGKCVTGGRLNVAKALETCVIVSGVAPSSGFT